MIKEEHGTVERQTLENKLARKLWISGVSVDDVRAAEWPMEKLTKTFNTLQKADLYMLKCGGAVLAGLIPIAISIATGSMSIAMQAGVLAGTVVTFGGCILGMIESMPRDWIARDARSQILESSGKHKANHKRNEWDKPSCNLPGPA